MEDFRQVKGFEGLYLVSKYGFVLSLGNGLSTNSLNKKKRILKTTIKKNGYEQVKIFKDGKPYFKTVHRIVAESYLDNQKKEVNHIDGNKLNNFYKNLEWVTSSENQIHAFKLGLQVAPKGKDSNCSIPIKQYDLEMNLIKVWDSINEVKRELGFNSVGIIGCCKERKKYKTAYGFKWKYL
jgi:hypothetical protein